MPKYISSRYLTFSKVFFVLLYLSVCAFAQHANAVQEPSSGSVKALEQKININTASAEELSNGLVGIGIKKAEAIVEFRKANGAFRQVEELVEVNGIGEATLEKNKDRLTL